ncbi:hypothetical protein OL239_08440 [Arthrobacter sp. ATA002]|uniref:hypothetical protein n=1 Tax=Arthrobacter sp. ATA002 TaxID=2991715 RepID=UPI0022A67352|nr:hypothetical protein [Arthrobacter sp. ATA002]WAP53470.1 hypothetical protein OL239_08440 [Arthrobacter sp. ATA002]
MPAAAAAAAPARAYSGTAYRPKASASTAAEGTRAHSRVHPVKNPMYGPSRTRAAERVVPPSLVWPELRSPALSRNVDAAEQ